MPQEQPAADTSPALVVMVGPPGTGKSHLVREVTRRVSVDVVQTDAIRRTLAARPEYTPDESRRVFSVAHRRAEWLLRRGRNVVFDATNIHEWGRRALYRIADRAGARLLIVRTVAPDDVIQERLRGRASGVNPDDRSEAGWEVYARMKAKFEEIERPHLIVDTSLELEPAVQEMARFIQGHS